MVLSSFTEITEARGANRYRVRDGFTGATIEANAQQLSVLELFRVPTAVDAVLEANLVARSPTNRAFLDAAVAAGVLTRANSEGMPQQATSWPSPSFCHAPVFDPENPAGFVVVGVPWDRSTTAHPGARFGPQSIRMATDTWRYQLEPLTLRPLGFFDAGSDERVLQGVRWADAGDVIVWPGEAASGARARTEQVVRQVLGAGSIPVVLGGDHSITRSVLEAYDDAPLAIVHFDAHTDRGDLDMGGGMHHGNVMTAVLDELPHVVKLIQVGLRGVSASSPAADERVVALGIDGVRARGVEATVERVVAAVPAGARVYVSLDIDVVDPSCAPSTGTPVPGGLWPHELKALVRGVAARVPCCGLDVVEVAATSGPADGTGAVAAGCVLAFAQGMVDFLTASDDAADR